MINLTNNDFFDVVIVGAGPAGLLAADAILDNLDLRVLLVEKGGDFQIRQTCSLFKKNKCVNCDINCKAICGVGGSTFLFGGKVSEYPAGSGLARLRGHERAKEELNIALSIFQKHGMVFERKQISDKQKNDLCVKCERENLKLKSYPSHFVNSGTNQYCLTSLQNELERKNLYFAFHHTFLDFKFNGDFYNLEILKKTGEKINIKTQNLQIGVGEAGTGWLAKNKDRFVHKIETIDIGIRLEMPQEIMKPFLSIAPDLKIKTYAEDGSELRTYCTTLDALLIPCQNDGFVVIDGAWSDKYKRNAAAVTLFNRTKLEGKSDTIDNFLELAKKVYKKSNGRVIFESMGSFLTGEKPDNWVPVESLDGIAVEGSVNSILPLQIQKNIKYFINSLEKVIPGFSNHNNTVIGLAADKLWPVFELNENFESSMPNLYLIGDCGGLCRGILQAATTGLIAGKDVALKELKRKNKQKRKETLLV